MHWSVGESSQNLAASTADPDVVATRDESLLLVTDCRSPLSLADSAGELERESRRVVDGLDRGRHLDE
jgi:hypothetical protein